MNMIEKEEITKMLYNYSKKLIENKKYEENMTHETFVKEMKKISDCINENCLKEVIPCIKKEKRKEILEKYRSILLQLVDFTFEIGDYLFQKEDVDKLSFEESDELLTDLLKNL